MWLGGRRDKDSTTMVKAWGGSEERDDRFARSLLFWGILGAIVVLSFFAR